MSLQVIVYTKGIQNEWLNQIVGRLNSFDMKCEIEPNAKLDNQSGFLAFKFKIQNEKFSALKDVDLISGFEIYVEDFNLEKELEKLNPQKGFFDKLFNKKKEYKNFAPKEHQIKLDSCDMAISFIWHAADTFEVRFASLASAILSEIANGVCTYPADDIWYDNANFINTSFNEIKEYEEGLKDEDIRIHKFEGWN